MRSNSGFIMIWVFRFWVFSLVFWLVVSSCYSADRQYIEQQAGNTRLAIFVHGFIGDYLETWGKFPELLQADSSLDNYDFLFWGYPSRFFRQNEDIGTTGKHLKSEIDYLAKPCAKIVLIGHSMGGLVIRSYLVQAFIDGKGRDLNTIADVLLFGVPNEGDLKANLVPTWVNDQIADIGVASQFITELRKYLLYQKFHHALKLNGLLFVGSSEMLLNPVAFGFESAGPFFYRKTTL
ncbi:hypothetical protein C2W62_26795 [Candidatus Entotheonella serta]|nr:hypothetical protein C2W62_26795 [Candidatus Entotheonella serta]